MERLKWLYKNRSAIAPLKMYYKANPWDFITDWGVTFEPRNIERELIATIPFVLWPKQEELVRWMHGRWKARQRGLVEKSRDFGVTWIAVGFGVTMFLFHRDFICGYGSRKEELVDKRGDEKSIFEKLWFFLENLPGIFRPAGMNERLHRSHMRISNPEMGGALIGEAGDQIGRGGRTSIYMVDEAAFIERQERVDSALSQTTNCQIDISTVNTSGNAFYKKRQRFNGTDRIFICDWRDDPRKDDEWYRKQCEEHDEATVAQEIDRDYNATSEDSFIPAKWVTAAIDAHKLLGFKPSGMRVTAFDPADTGDARAVANRWGSVILEADQLDKGDITNAIPWAVDHSDAFRADTFIFDADGMGAPVMKVALQQDALRTRLQLNRTAVLAYNGSGGVVDGGESRRAKYHEKDKPPVDIYANYRAQTWTWVYERFRLTYEAVTRARAGHVVQFDPDMLISIDSGCKFLHELVAELSRPFRMHTPNGKILVESKKHMREIRNVDSPNMADCVVMAISVRAPTAQKKGIVIEDGFTPHDPAMGY